MDYTKKTNQLLNELKKSTGLNLSLSEKDLAKENIEKTYSSLLTLSNAYMINDSSEAVLRRWMTGGCSESDFLSAAGRLRIDPAQVYTLYYFELDKSIDSSVISVIKQSLADSHDSFIITLTDSTLAILDRTRSSKETKEDAFAAADNIITLLSAELFINAKASVSFIVSGLLKLPEFFSKACYAIKEGTVFQPEKTVYSYDDMGEGRFLYELPKETCAEYISEVLGSDFKPYGSHLFEGDTLFTVECFLHNDLNIAETSRQLHIHRNTLLYRIDQIQKETGLDIRHFKDAMRYYLSELIINKKKLPE